VRRLAWWLALGVVLGVGRAAPADGQTQVSPDPSAPLPAQEPPGTVPDSLVDRALIHAGPFFLHPYLALQDMGIDTNVLNENEEPQSDFTFTLVPIVSGGFRAGPARLLIVDRVEYVWYRELTSERSLNGGLSGQFEVRFNRLRPFLLGQIARSRARKGDEIDARAWRSEPMYGAGVDLDLASRTWLALEYRHAEIRYDAGESYQGVPLDQALNGRTRTSSAGLRFELTPLTTFTLTGRLEQNRFTTSTFRDNDSYLLGGAFAFDPEALLAGSATVGYRGLQARTEGTPDFRGVIANISLTYTGLPTTRLGVGVSRDIAYSYEDQYAYYVDNSLSASLTQNVVGPVELVARGRVAWLDYTGEVSGAPDRQDRVSDYGGGVGFKLGAASRLGFEAAWVERRSDVPDRNYQGLRLFGSINYGF